MNEHVGYVVKQYPRLSETFVLNEILGVEAAGLDTSIFSLRPGLDGRFHPELAQVRGTVSYLPTTVDRLSFYDIMQWVPSATSEGLARVMEFLQYIPEPRRPRMLLQGLGLARAVGDRGIDHLHAHFLTVAAHTCHVAHLLTGTPYTVTAHAKDIYRIDIDWDLARHVADQAATVVTVCDANREHLRTRLPNASITRIYNGLGPQPAPAGMDEREAALLLGVGRLVPKKGFDRLIHAVAQLRAERSPARAVLIGDGELGDDLRALALRLGVAAHVDFIGAQTTDVIADWMRRATLLVAPCVVGPDGNQDALPTVLVEALAAGLPIVSTHVAGIPEIVDHGVHGSLVSADPPELAREIGSLLRDPALLQRMSAAGSERWRERFERNDTARQLVAEFAGCRATVAAA